MQVRFLDPLRVEEVGDGTTWRLISDLRCEICNEMLVVPASFETDFSSIPRILRSLVPVLGRQNKASVIHDRLYTHQIHTRALADWIFYCAMRNSGVRFPKRVTMYLGVRIGGWKKWYF